MLRGAAASLHAAPAGVDNDAADLRRALAKSRRRDQLRAAALVLPLFVFLAACFVLPIGAMLSRGVIDTRDLLYYASLIGVCLVVAQTSLESRRWR